MCGFIFALDDADFDLLKHCNSIVHRGPTSTKYYIDDKIKCGFNRLSIVDSNPLSDQPMIDKNRRWLLLFNGEIYNFRALRTELINKYNYTFETESDSEVLLIGLGNEGRRFLTKLNGIFSFVFVDLRDNSILAGRDFFGVKPLYFSKKNKALYFCSESRPLANITEAALDRKSLALMLSSGSTMMGGAIYSNVFSVKPNSVVEIRHGNVKEYEVRPIFVCNDEITSEEKVISMIASAVDRQMPSIEFGLLLSGGIDSTLLLSMLYKSKMFSGTYAVNVNDDEMSEKHWQDMALAHFKSEKSTNFINLGVSDFQVDKLRDVVVAADIPFFHPSYVGATRMAKKAFDDGLKVLISGEGADEIFLGYKWFFEDESIHSIFEYTPLKKLSRFLGVNELDTSFLDGMGKLEFFQKHYLQRWLTRSDLTGMRHSVEIRVPFLDMDLVEMVNQLGGAYKIKHGAKWMLKNQLLKTLPEEFVYRRKKGFDFPLNSWMQEDHLRFLKANKDLFEINDEEIMSLLYSDDYKDKRMIFTLCSFALWSGR
jgi:asparagine synthase (glutamine-hydrolysing)